MAIFATEVGTALNRYKLTQRSFRPLLAKAGLPQIRFHDLRHTCATILLTAGQHPKFVQEMLGHATIAITLDTYSHALPGMGDGLADAMESAIMPLIILAICAVLASARVSSALPTTPMYASGQPSIIPGRNILLDTWVSREPRTSSPPL
jgi:hypothetical protein